MDAPSASAARAAVFLDRDGTLNRTFVEGGVPRPPADLDRLEILPGVPEALARLKRAGFVLVVVTNQPDVAKGVTDRALVEAIHARLRRQLPLDEIQCCYHEDADDCACRKPRPGLIIDAAARLGLDLRNSFLVGDRWRDIGAGRGAGCTTILLRQPYSERERAEPDYDAADLTEAAEIILRCWEERSG
jgi:D-glycero-D-manno-heptose 1,7-bisphosphate phosphatase